MMKKKAAKTTTYSIMRITHQISHWIGIMLILTVLAFAGGCGKKTITLSLYCSISHLPVAEKLAKTFRQVYGVTVVCIPMDDAASLMISDQDEEDKTSTKIKTFYEIRRDEVYGSERVRQLKNWLENTAYKNFAQYLLDNGSGDLYLCDSPVNLQRLKENNYVVKTRPLAYVTPVLMVHADKGSFFSVEDVLQSSETLGIVHRDLGGLGCETDRFLQSLRQKDPALSNGKIIAFDNETLMLKAWEEKQIAAAICWDSTAARGFPDIVPLALPRTEILAVPLTMCDLICGSDYEIMDFFSIFASSKKGQALFKEFEYKAR